MTNQQKDNLYISHVTQTDSVFVYELFGRQKSDKCTKHATSTYSERQRYNSSSYINTSVQKMPSSTPFISPDIEFQTAPVSDYTIGSIIKHTNLGIGKIIDITEIKEGVNIITIRFSDNRIDKLPLESVVESNLIMIGII